MTTTAESVGKDVSGVPLNLDQLEHELASAGVTVNGLGTQGPGVGASGATFLFTYDAEGAPSPLPAGADPIVQAHIALRDKTDEEYAEEFQAASTTAVRRQEIRDITSGLLPREQVRVDNGLPLEDPAPAEDPLETIRAVPLGSTTDELRDAIVAYLERFGG